MQLDVCGVPKQIDVTVVTTDNVLAKSPKNALIEYVEGETFRCLPYDSHGIRPAAIHFIGAI